MRNDATARLTKGDFFRVVSGACMGELPGDECAYVLEGTMLLEIAGGQSVTLKADRAAACRHDDRNPSQTDTLKFLVCHVAKKGEPLAVPVQ
jgi:hypothetical protein